MLKPRRAWKGGRDKAELVEAMRKELAEVPGLRLSFSQPIALRVNELISGVKSDLAVKVFGPDLAGPEGLRRPDRRGGGRRPWRGRREGRAGLGDAAVRPRHRSRGGRPATASASAT